MADDNSGRDAGAITLSVVICTWNRSAALRDTLSTFAVMNFPYGFGWELLVVDNASTDDTASVVASVAKQLSLTYLLEPTPGLSSARRAGVARARGSWIAWLDDDVLLAPGWMQAIAQVVTERPELDYAAGPTQLHFDGAPPRWLQMAFKGVSNFYSVRDLGAGDFPLGQNDDPYGANMLVRRGWHERFSFDDALGFSHGKLVGGEESQLFARIRSAGGNGWWVGGMAVKHVVLRDRHRLAWLNRRLRSAGDEIVGLGVRRGRAVILGAPAWMWLDFVRSAVAALVPISLEKSVRHLARARVLLRAISVCVRERPALLGGA